MALDQNNATISPPRRHPVFQFVCFVFFATVGMGVIGACLLAKPLTVYFNDQQRWADYQERQEKLKNLYQQQQALLENADNPMVVERVAVNHLHYRSAVVAAAGQSTALLPELPATYNHAIQQVEHVAKPQKPDTVQKWAEALAQRPREQTMLLILGSALTVVSMTCFYRQRD